jgi:4-amino-4-deoxy-L-arabinose transferase-like glycosyltransferase
MAAPPKTLLLTAPSARARLLDLLVTIALGLAALLPRTLDLGGFLTVDEANFWLARSATFLDALRRGDWAATAISTHPGVTTMWLGSIGLLLREALVDRGLLPGDFPTALALMRLPGALAHTATVLLGYRLLRHMLPGWTALLAALLWAADPFVVAYSRLLHVDALAGSFMTLSLLAACVYWHHGASRGALALSGVAAGLAFLSKSPALVLLPAIGGIALLQLLRAAGNDRRELAAAGALRPAVLALLLWGLLAGLTAFTLWPALWSDPLAALEQLRTGVEAEAAQPHMLGNFFLGRPDDAPGALFYPVTLALRLTPITLAGLLALGLLAAAELRASLANGRAATHTHERERGARAEDLAALALFVLLLVVALSLFPKKFNRYLVPAFPALDILAAVGIARAGALVAGVGSRAGSRFADRRSPATPPSGSTGIGRVALVLVMLLATANAAYWHPYGIAAFNQALGGSPAGARTFAVGWGEGFEQVATWLNQQPDITGVATVSRIPVVQSPYMRPGAFARTPRAGSLPPDTGYVVVYVSQVQRGAPSPPFDQFYGHATPLHTISLHGVEYAWIYQPPPPVQQARPASFGEAIRLRGFSQEGPASRGATVRFLLQWEARAIPELDYTLFAHLIGADGERYAQIDLPLASGAWQPGRFVATDLPLTIPAEAPPGPYQLLIGLYDPASGERLPLVADLPLEPGIGGPNALPLARLFVE